MLQVQNLKREVNGREILTDITVSVKRGEALFIRGPSGVGKSILLRSIAYLDPFQVFAEAACPFEHREEAHIPVVSSNDADVSVSKRCLALRRLQISEKLAELSQTTGRAPYN